MTQAPIQGTAVYKEVIRALRNRIVEEIGNKMILRCSDGRGEPIFDDPVVEIEFLDD